MNTRITSLYTSITLNNLSFFMWLFNEMVVKPFSGLSTILIFFEKRRSYKELLTFLPILDTNFQRILYKPVDSRFGYTSFPRILWPDEKSLEVLIIRVASCEIVHFG